jgi:hypothetical protein
MERWFKPIKIKSKRGSVARVWRRGDRPPPSIIIRCGMISIPANMGRQGILVPENMERQGILVSYQ